jgi:DNA-binding beta-propeller fold protein YncE
MLTVAGGSVNRQRLAADGNRGVSRDFGRVRARIRGMNRRELLTRAAATAPLLWAPGRALAAASGSLALVTADAEAHVVVLRLADGHLRRRIHTREGPRSIEAAAGGAVVAHTTRGVITLLEARATGVRRVLGGFSQPRYTAVDHARGRAYVSDSGTGEVAIVDLRAGRVIRRLAVGDHARHLSLSPDGRTLWVALGNRAPRVAIVDVRSASRARVTAPVTPPFRGHDVAFTPSGHRVWVSSGNLGRLAVYTTGGTLRRTLPADQPPQHVTFRGGVAFVASGDSASLRVHALDDGRRLRRTGVPVGSYNVQAGGGRIVTPSLSGGQLTVLDGRGRVVRSGRVASAAHDACVVRG